MLVAGIVLAVAVGLEVLGRRVVEAEVADRLIEAGVTGNVDVVMGRSWWRPTVWPALLTGAVDQVVVTVQDGELAGFPVRDVRYRLSGIRGDLSLRRATLEVDAIGEGAVRMTIDPTDVGETVGAELAVRDGRLIDRTTGATVRAAVEGDNLVLRGSSLGGSVAVPSVPVTDPYLLPCRPSVRLLATALELRCAGDDLPGILRGPLAGPPEPPPEVPAEDLPPPQSTVRSGD